MTQPSANDPDSPAFTLPEPSKRELIVARDVQRSYRDGERTLHVLRGVSLTIHRGEFVAIIGRSGSGKSTLLHLLGALDRATSGTIRMEDQDYAVLGDGQLAALRSRRIGFIYQFHHLLPEFSALENVLMPGMILRQRQADLYARATQLLTAVGLAERLTHRPSKLSGGEQQRVALARALMNDPDVVLADEPTGDLDQDTGREVLRFVIERTVLAGKTLVMVTHDPAIAARAHRQFRLTNGVLTPAGADASGADTTTRTAGARR